MKTDPLIDQLRRWGNATVNRYALSRGDRSIHVLQKNRDLAPGTRENAARQLAGRDGRDRRRFMAERSGVRGLSIVPTWAVDPVRGTNDAGAPRDNPEIAVDQGIPEDLLWVERAIREIGRTNLLRAMCVREEFTTNGTQQQKAGRVALAYGGKLSVWQYRRELQRAVDYLSGKKAAA